MWWKMTRCIATRCRNANRNWGGADFMEWSGGDKDAVAANMAMLWILNLSDGMHSLLDIAEQANLPFGVIRRTAQLLQHSGLLTICDTTLDKPGALGTAQ
jgi:aminopeptidase-like protein